MLSRPGSGPSFSLIQVLLATAAHVRAYIPAHVEAEYVYHDLGHTLQVVEHARQLARLEGLSQEAGQLLELAAWFHDTGYARGPEGHELRSCINAKAFLRPRGLGDGQLDQVCRAIGATQLPQQPQTLLGQLLCDADMGHLGTKNYWPQCRRVRQELLLTKGVVMSEAQWIDFELSFLEKHRYFTESAMGLFGKRKRKHLKQLRKQKLALAPTQMKGVQALAKRDKKKKKRRKAVDAAMRSAPSDPSSAGGAPVVTASAPMEEVTARPENDPLLLAAVDRMDRQAAALLVAGTLAVVLIVIGLIPVVSAQQLLLFPGALLLLTIIATLFFTVRTLRVVMPHESAPVVLQRKQHHLSVAYAILLCGLVATVLVFAVALLV